MTDDTELLNLLEEILIDGGTRTVRGNVPHANYEKLENEGFLTSQSLNVEAVYYSITENGRNRLNAIQR